MTLAIIIIILMLLISSLSQSSLTALSAVSESQIEEDAEKGHKRAKRVYHFLTKDYKYKLSMSMVSTLSMLITGIVSFHQFSKPLFNLFGNESAWINALVIFIFVISLWFFHVVFTQLIPRRLANKYPLKFSYMLISYVMMIMVFMKPFVIFFEFTSSILGRLVGLLPHEGNKVVTEEEIRNIVEESSKTGSIEEEEGEMIQNVFDFSDSTVDEIMTHRTDISAIDVQASKDEIIDFILHEQYTRFPVYRDNIDHIIGTLHVKDLFKHLYDTSDIPIKKLIRKPYFIPESKKNSELFKEMQARKNHIAIVLDEFGGTAGLVTIEDLVEEILGDIADEYDTDDYEIQEIESGCYMVDGLMNINDVEDIIEADLPTDDYDTISGFILGQLGRFPHEGETIVFTYHGFTFEVIEIKKRIISKVKICKNSIERESED